MAVVDGWVRLGFTAGKLQGLPSQNGSGAAQAWALSNKLRGVDKPDLAVTATTFGLALLLQPFQQFISSQRDVE